MRNRLPIKFGRTTKVTHLASDPFPLSFPLFPKSLRIEVLIEELYLEPVKNNPLRPGLYDRKR